MKGLTLSGARVWLALSALATVLLLAGCGSDEDASDSSGELLVAAAASMQQAFDEMGPLFEKETGAKVTFSYGATGPWQSRSRPASRPTCTSRPTSTTWTACGRRGC